MITLETSSIAPISGIASRNVINVKAYAPEELPDNTDFAEELFDSSFPRPYLCLNPAPTLRQNRHFIQRKYEKIGIPEGWGAD